ncbi:MAG: alpha/beta fold hydrolase [Saprospiraceae bacterium]|uniref:Alpha/beta fold hydrolase n=1 Tax=Candidatus Opimibacter skivensis TaxID=2982028 RepID=A0A9D7XSM4_9BACT|nr:alpha/beta fold hydrolase [Candidatus Opimibacter skivensis]
MKIFTFIICLFVVSVCAAQTEGIVKSVDIAPIYYRTFGSGQPLLIINGGPGMNSNGFENLARKLSEHYKTIIYDQRGTGKSILPILDSTTITMDLMIEDVESLRKFFKLDRWSILGHSFGGMVASYYATKYPERIDKMILSSSGGIDLGLLSYVNDAISSKLSSEEKDSLKYWNDKLNTGDTTFAARLGRGRALAPAYLQDRKYIPVLALRLTQGNGDINGLIWTDLQRINYDCTEKLKSFDRPVLIIQGKQDIIDADTGERAHKVLKNSRFVLMDHCGHYGWLDNEEVYFKEINSFMNY